MTVSVGGKQRKRETVDIEAAKALQQQWELERCLALSSMRPRITVLTNEKLRRAEAAEELLKGSGIDLLQAAQIALRNRPAAILTKKLAEGLREFLEGRKQFISSKHLSNYRLTGTRFSEFTGDVTIADVSTAIAEKWLRGLDVGPKSWNNYRNDLSAIFRWFVSRSWTGENPFSAVERHSRRQIGHRLPERLSIAQCRALMASVEAEHPEWVVFFALALFAGLRPDPRDGELAKLSRVVGRDGAGRYFTNGVIEITAEVSKVGMPRQFHVPENLKQWLAKYPVTPDTICPCARYEYYTRIRPKYSISHDGLRHTGISAHVARFGQLGLTALEFGTSEGIIKRHYLNRMEPSEADEFYSIHPRSVGGQAEAPNLLAS